MMRGKRRRMGGFSEGFFEGFWTGFFSFLGMGGGVIFFFLVWNDLEDAICC